VDKRLYALRDVTATVECIPLIAASIMSKKLSEGLTGLVLDVKMGSGAFITDPAKSRELAETMIALGESHGCPTVALLTAMDRPLGRACGNALEVKDQAPEDLMAVTMAEAVEMLMLAGRADRAAARRELEAVLKDGRAARKFQEIIEAQGGNPAVVDDPALLPTAALVEVYKAPRDGTVLEVAPRAIGRCIVQMGGGRQRVEDVVDPTVGLVITARPGQRVERGEPLASIYARDEAGLALAVRTLGEAVRIGEGKPDPLPLIGERLTAAGAERLG
jgi:thymidine phosphorylase